MLPSIRTIYNTGNKRVFTLCNACLGNHRTLCGTTAESESQYTWEIRGSFEVKRYTKTFAVIPRHDIIVFLFVKCIQNLFGDLSALF